MISRAICWLMEQLFGPSISVLNELPVATGSLTCRKCGSTTWHAASTDPDEHPLRAGVIACSDCTPGVGLPS